MRGLLQPLLIVIAVVLVALGLTAGVRTFSGSPDDWQPLPYKCSGCQATQVVDSDMIGWRCNHCGRWHTSGEGRQHVEYDLTP